MASDIYMYIYMYLLFIPFLSVGARINWVNDIFVCVGEGGKVEKRQGEKGGKGRRGRIRTSFNMRTLPERPWISVSF